MNGILIVVMGIDSAGKTTLINNIKRCSINVPKIKCMSIFDNSIFTQELEKTAEMQGKTRRQVYSPELRSIVWRNDLINNTLTRVVPELEKGNIVILDRYCLCNKIYSSLHENGLMHMDKILEALPKPDLGIFLDVNVYVTIKRIEERKKEQAPYETLEKLEELRKKYLVSLPYEGYSIIKIDANLPANEVTKQTLKNIMKIMNQKTQKGRKEEIGRNI